MIELPHRNIEGWAVVDLMGRTRIVGRVQLVRVGDATLLEVQQPRIVAGDADGYGGSDPEFVVIEEHKVLINPANLYKLSPVPSLKHCVNAFLEVYGTYNLEECPARWAPQDARLPLYASSLRRTDVDDFDDDDDIPI